MLTYLQPEEKMKAMALGETMWNWLHMIYATSVVEGLTSEYHVEAPILSSLFYL
jgi:hypothetical protein